MQLILQFPIADARRFIDSSLLYKSPTWPRPTQDDEFVRYFGHVKRRLRGGVDDWVGESEICEGDHALQFTENCSLVSNSPPLRIGLRCAYRRFYMDGRAVGKYEVAVTTESRRARCLRRDETRRLLEHFLSLTVAINGPKPAQQTSALLHAGKRLTRLYTRATMPERYLPRVADWWVQAGVPTLLLEYHVGRNRFIEPPSSARSFLLPNLTGLTLSHSLMRYQGRDISLWMLGRGPGADKDKARRLRLYLLRLHAEHECLRLIANAIMDRSIDVNRDTPESNDLQKYLKEANRRISEADARLSEDFDPQIAEIARASIHLINPGHYQSLLSDLKRLDLRVNIARNVDALMQKAGRDLTLYYFAEGAKMENSSGDTINAQGAQIGAIKNEGTQSGFSFIQQQPGQALDLAALSAELDKVLAAVRAERRAKEDAGENVDAQEEAIATLKAAKTEADNNNQTGVLSKLASAGKWVAKVASDVGAKVVTELIEHQLGMK